MRARIIKPGFFKNEELAEIGPTGMLLFAGLWTLADREGRLEDRPRRIKVEVLPYFDCDVNSLLDELAQRGFIVRYKVRGIAFIAIPSWSKHQQAHVREAESLIPPPSEADEEPENHGEAQCEAQPRQCPAQCEAQPRQCLGTALVSEIRHARVKVIGSSLDLDPRDQEPSRDQEKRSLDREPSRDQEPEIADQIPPLVVNKALTGRESKPKATAPKPAMATRLPDSWPLTPEREQYAISQGVDPERTHQDFCDYWHAKAGPNARKLDWDATWRTWCRRAAERGYGPSRASPLGLLPGAPMSKAEMVLAAAYQQAVMEEARERASLGYDEK
jgi:hypothetical protein